MCRWKALVIFIVLCKQLSAQPIGIVDNDRAPRQLDFDECCPCNKGDDSIEGRVGLDDAMSSGSENTFTRPRYLDDCPCRYSDSQGASSILFSNALRSSGNFLRSDDKKENPKPLFNPEVDLAASVLETLKEVTDEEYQDALMRDAAKTAANTADDFLFGDTTPEESANIVTIVVRPKFTDSNEEDVPVMSHSQKSRCIHPLDSARNSISKMQLLPNIKPSIFRKKKYDMENGVGASNIHEQIVSANLNARDLDLNPSYMRSVKNKTRISSNNDADEYCDVRNMPNFRSTRLNNNLEEEKIPTVLQTKHETSNLFSRIPKIKLTGWSPGHSENSADLDLAASKHNLEGVEALYQRSRPDWLKVKENNSPWSLRNVLNLKDVELIPLKQLLSEKTKRAKNNKSKLLFPSSRDVVKMTPKYDVVKSISDYDSDLMNSKASCYDEQIIKDESYENLTKQTSSFNNFDTKTKALPTPSTASLDKALENKDNMKTANMDCVADNNYDQNNMMADTSNKISEVIAEPVTLEHNSEHLSEDVVGVPAESINQNEQSQQSQYGLDILNTNPKLKLVKHNSMDKAVSNIRENIGKKLEELNDNIKKSIKNNNYRNLEINNSNLRSNSIPMSGNINIGKECETETIEITSEHLTDGIDEEKVTRKTNLSIDDLQSNGQRLKPQIGFENIDNASAAVVSLQDLQRLSDSLLLEEENQIRNNEILVNTKHNDNDSNTSSSNQRPVGILLEAPHVDKFNEKSSGSNACYSDVSKSSQLDLSDGSVEDMRVTKNTVYKEDNTHYGDDVASQFLSDVNDVIILPNLTYPLTEVGENLLSSFVNRDSNIDKFTLESLNQVKAENKCNNTNLDETKTFETDPNDSNIGASHTIMNTVPSNDDSLINQEVLPRQKSISKKPKSNFNEVLKIMPHNDLLNDIKLKLSNLFDRGDVNTKEFDSNSSNDGQMESIVESEQNNRYDKQYKDLDNYETCINIPKTSQVSTLEAINKDDRVFDSQSTLPTQATILKEPFLDLNNIVNTLTPDTIPAIDDRNVQSINMFNSNDGEINSFSENIKEENNLKSYRNFKSSDDDICNINFASPKSSHILGIDPNVDGSEAIFNILPKHGDNLNMKSVQSPLNLTDISNINSRESLHDQIKMKLSNLFDSNNKNRETKPLESLGKTLKSDRLDFLNPVMASDASTSSFQTRLPSSRLPESTNLNTWDVNPKTSLFKSKLPILKDFHIKTLNDDLISTIPVGQKSQASKSRIAKFRNNKYSPSILNFPLDIKPTLSNAAERNSNTRSQASDKFSSFFENSNNAAKTTLQGIPIDSFRPLRKPITSSTNILDAIAKNHEDFNDKIRSWHMDFSDRMESVHNDLLGHPKTLSNNLKNQNNAKQKLNYKMPTSSGRQSTKLSTFKSITSKPVKRISLPSTAAKKFRMPSAESLLVPKTVKVPDLRPTSINRPPLALLKESTTSSSDTPETKQSSDRIRTQIRDTPLQRQYNYKKKATVTFSFSTTPLPYLSADNKFNNTLPSSQSFNKPLPPKLISDKALRLSPINISDGKTDNLNSWPKATESSFLTQVKDAVQSRLSMNSPTNLKQSGLPADYTKSPKNYGFRTDMTQAASEPGNINVESLKENVSYKCKMVCTKE